MRVKDITNYDMDKIKNLWDYCFEKKDTAFFKWYFSNYCQSENVIGCFSNDSLMGMVHLNPYTISLNGKAFQTDYLVGVATTPEFRRRGVLKALLEYAFCKMKKQNKPIAILMPSAAGVYIPYGFAFCYLKCKYTMPILYLADCFKQQAGYDLEFLSKDDYAILQQVYEKFTENYNGFVLREQKNWYNLIEECLLQGGHLIGAKKDGKYCAYMLYLIKENSFEVVELVFVDECAKKTLLSFASQHFSQCDNFTWYAPDNDLTYLDFITNKYYPVTYPFMMARIIDPITAFEMLEFKTPVDAYVSIQIKDSFIKENNAVFTIGNNKMQQSDEKPMLIMDIATLTQLYFGTYTAEQLYTKGFIETFDNQAISILQTIFVKNNNYINEFF